MAAADVVPAAGFSDEPNSADCSWKQTQTRPSASNSAATGRLRAAALTLDRPLLEDAGKYTDLEALDPAEGERRQMFEFSSVVKGGGGV